MLEEMEARARAMLISAGATENEIAFSASVDVRYKGQGYEIEVPISGIGLRGSDAASVRAEVAKRFSEHYERAYGRVLGRADLEAITWRVRAEAGQETKAASPAVRPASADAASGRRRRIYFGPRVGFEDAPVYDRYSMASGSIGVGPALMQEREPRSSCRLMRSGAWTST